MKRFLLIGAAAMIAASASAAEAVLAETDFTTATSYNFWKSDVTNAEVKDGALVITNEAKTENFWDLQYIVADNFTLVGGTEYTVDVKIKGFSGTLHYNFGTWGSNVNGEAAVAEANDWQNVVFTATAKEDTDGTAHLLLQSGDFVGTYSIASVKITYNEEGQGGGEEPGETSKNVLMSMYPGDGALIGWGLESSREVVTEDGKEALKVTNPSAGQMWEAQIALDYDFVAGTTYYLTFDVKGDAGTITSGFQQTNGYLGCGNFDNFAITSDWNTVTIKGTAQTSDNGDPNRWVANIGEYVGTFYIANMTLYTEGSNAVEAIAPVKVEMTGVYNLNGVKVADELNSSLPKGIYIVNGKKVVR